MNKEIIKRKKLNRLLNEIKRVNRSMKICSKCKVEKDLIKFSKNKSQKDGYHNWCKKCHNQYNKNNKEQQKQYQKQYHIDKPEKSKENHKNYYLNNKGKILKQRKQYFIDNKEKIKEKQKQWLKNNPEKIAAINANYRVLKEKQSPELTKEEQDRIKRLYEIRDLLNHDGIDFHVDHIQPISKGGLHHIDNLQILPNWLNSEKSGKWPLTENEQIRYEGFKI